MIYKQNKRANDSNKKRSMLPQLEEAHRWMNSSNKEQVSNIWKTIITHLIQIYYSVKNCHYIPSWSHIYQQGP